MQINEDFGWGMVCSAVILGVILLTVFFSTMDRPFLVQNPQEGETCVVKRTTIVDCYRDDTVGKGE
jgi:hypothetical protein